jgi:hypothetical protein
MDWNYLLPQITSYQEALNCFEGQLGNLLRVEVICRLILEPCLLRTAKKSMPLLEVIPDEVCNRKGGAFLLLGINTVRFLS